MAATWTRIRSQSFLENGIIQNSYRSLRGIMIFIFMPVYTAAVMIGVSKILEAGLGLDYNIALLIFAVIVAAYVIFGGLKGVMYSDAFQGHIDADRHDPHCWSLCIRGWAALRRRISS